MFEKSVYVSRRKKLKEKIGSGIVLIMGHNDSPMNYPDNIYHYRQSSTFLYFFGHDMPGLAGIIDIDNNTDILFGDDVSLDDIIWMGPQETMKEKADKTGVDKVLEYNQLSVLLKEAQSKNRKIHFLPQYRYDTMFEMSKLLGIEMGQINEHVSIELIKAAVSLREIKADYEIKELEIAADIGYEMHVTAMKMAAKAGIKEQEIAGRIEGIAVSYGMFPSFPIILSQNGQTLHNHDHSQILEVGRMLLTDAGAESNSHYASDFTRTVPVGGKFNQRQKDIYSIVLAANNHAASLIKPGVTYKSIHIEAAKVIANGLRDLGIMKGNPEEAVMQGVHAMFMPHGLGHQMGLDVHDMEDYGEDFVGYDEEVQREKVFGLNVRMGKTLRPGHVITNEPGIYFIPELYQQWKKANKFAEYINYDKVAEFLDFGGVRLEDDILVTDSGSKLIGKRIPITVEEIEETMKA